MKVYLLFTFLIASFCSFSQDNGAVWATVEDVTLLKVQKTNNEKVKYTSPKLQKLVNLFNINNVIPAFPNSKDKSLHKVYEFQCNCNSSFLS